VTGGADPGSRRRWTQTVSGERRWPMALGVIVAITLQVLLPDRHVFEPTYVFPLVEFGLLVALIITDPGRIDRRSAALRWLTMLLILLLTLDNLLAVIQLIDGILTEKAADTATVLLATGAAIWVTNVIAFSLWYWELDRSGPAARASGGATPPSFAFPEMQNPDYVEGPWMPQYVDYVYLAFTNATAFSPTDTMPLKAWAKLMMMAQSATSMAIGIFIIARAVNILN
jgi:uncharacterized membrane protein